MGTTKTIRIPNPTKELVSFIDRMQQQKEERLKMMRERFFKASLSK